MPEYNIKVEFEKKTYTFSCQDDQDVISAASTNGIDLPLVYITQIIQEEIYIQNFL